MVVEVSCYWPFNRFALSAKNNKSNKITKTNLLEEVEGVEGLVFGCLTLWEVWDVL
jgi:hypothetical protein